MPKRIPSTRRLVSKKHRANPTRNLTLNFKIAIRWFFPCQQRAASKDESNASKNRVLPHSDNYRRHQRHICICQFYYTRVNIWFTARTICNARMVSDRISEAKTSTVLSDLIKTQPASIWVQLLQKGCNNTARFDGLLKFGVEKIWRIGISVWSAVVAW